MSDNEQSQAPEHINIKVLARGGGEVIFKVKPTIKFEKLINAYAERAGHVKDSVRFIFDGARVKPQDTPQDLEMGDDDTIDAVIEQVRCRPTDASQWRVHLLVCCRSAVRTLSGGNLKQTDRSTVYPTGLHPKIL
ncbi:hypothetical protein CROQUDRAFT_93342 [Cronartium quercuum f. sp. fusiforme G11]|uniref:Ubiquitin-like domain-containing protein n=1 Tax=Cronartium quercuum f. sp. fusiforme G11 TaxID=708437 RepID=A0A9P6NLV3_9BASI|nr:hypothetical protein CROQUDRAFT_93342 [Cronartium quercuum f. sp. fusiforme G11]